MSQRLFVIVFTFLICKISVNAGNDNIVGSSLSPEETKLCNEIPRADIEQYLSTKTPYRVVANLDDKPINFEGCSPLRIWSVIRHGTRNPSKKVIENIKTQLKTLRDKLLAAKDVDLCPKQLESLSKWNFTVSPEEEKYLVAEGEDELIELAERMQNRFPKLLPEVYNPKHYFFKYTATQRTLKSAQSFATGLFGRHRIGNIIYPEALHKDPVLRFYKLCSRWKTDVDKNPQTFDNVRKFLQTEHMLNVLEQLRKKTKLSNIDAHTARLIYTVCAFETAWQRRKEPSVWCQLLDHKSIQILEFAEDLEYYWNDGYGYELTHQIACPAIADMFKHIDPQSTLANSTFYFTHSGTLLKVLAHLGLYKDEAPLTFQDYGKERKWRTSAIDAFATNVAFVLYDCQNKGPMVLTLHQEQVVHIPGCPIDNDLCSLATLRKLFAHSLDNCNFNEMCVLNEKL